MEKQQRIKLKINVKQLESVKGYLIFIAFSVASMAWLILRGSWLAALIATLIWLRLYRSRQFLIIVSCFLASLLFGSYFYWQVMTDYQGSLAVAEKIEAKLLVDPNSLVIDGDSLTLEGKNQVTKEIYRLQYRLQSEDQKNDFLNQTVFFELTAELELELPVGQRNLNGFDYRQFLLEKGIYRVGNLDTIKEQVNYPIKSLTQLIKVWRRQLTRHTDQIFLPLTASYLKSLFLGVKDSTFKNQQDIWSQLGILHFFSISGMHVFFFVSHFRRLLLRLGLTLEVVFWIELLALFIYLFLAGFSTSVGRSVVYLGLSSLNRQFKWGGSELDCWSATLILSLILNPYLVFQAAGQLSFGLSFYIIYLKKIVTKAKPFLGQLSFSLALSILAIPIISAYFYEWHLLGMALTFLLMPVFNYLLLPILSLLLGLSAFMEVNWLSQFVETALEAFQQILGALGALSSFKVVTGYLPPLIYLSCLLVSLSWLHHYHQKKIARWLVLLLISCLPSAAKFTDFRGIVAFVDVGQGDSIFIQRPFRREAILIDTGGRLAFGSADSWQQKERLTSQASYTLIPFLKSRGVKQLDQVFISHADEDHFGDLKEVSKAIEIKELLYPLGSSQSAKFQRTLTALNGRPRQRVTSIGNFWQNSDYRLDVLSPKEMGDGGNDDSLALLVSLKGKKILLTGDLEETGERQLISNYPRLSADSLKVAHHGSRTSSTADFLSQLGAETAIISCGRNNRFGHPHEETLSRLREAEMEIYQTDQQDMIYYQWSPWSGQLSNVQTIRKSY